MAIAVAPGRKPSSTGTAGGKYGSLWLPMSGAEVVTVTVESLLSSCSTEVGRTVRTGSEYQ